MDNTHQEGSVTGQVINSPQQPVNTTSTTTVATEAVAQTIILPASTFKRLANSLLDWIASLLIMFAFIFVGKIIGGSAGTTLAILGYITGYLYYLIFESMWGSTIGKWITKTKVVDNHGNRPSFLRILGRSLARWIPFEAFSFLFSAHPRGWHDSISGTLVVSSELTDSELASLDIEAIKKQTGSNTAGMIVAIILAVIFTIAVVGILSSVVLASLSTARAKGQEAYNSATLSNLKMQSILYEDQQKTYKGFCSSPEAQSLLVAINAKVNINNDGVSAKCNDSKDSWAAIAPAPSARGRLLCIDNKSSGVVLIESLKNITSCGTKIESN